MLLSSDVVDVVEHVLVLGPDLAFTTLRDDSDVDGVGLGRGSVSQQILRTKRWNGEPRSTKTIAQILSVSLVGGNREDGCV